jgi:hypothetical protein
LSRRLGPRRLRRLCFCASFIVMHAFTCDITSTDVLHNTSLPIPKPISLHRSVQDYLGGMKT